MSELRLDYSITGTLEELIERSPWKHNDPLKQLQKINSYLYRQVQGGLVHIHSEYLKHLGNPTTLFFDPVHHFLPNATDSVVTKLGYAPKEYSIDINLRLSYSPDLFRFEIEDNGTGIDPQVEPKLFVEKIRSSKKDEPIAFGGKGRGLLYTKDDVEKLKGEFFYTNKGKDQGAIFGYTISLQKE